MDKREPVISRTYEKGAHRQAVFVYLLTGPEITGTVFEFVISLNNEEQLKHTEASGNKYSIRKRFLNHLMDLNEDGWKRMNVSPLNAEYRSFFEPEQF
jgi:hypothetical protein